MPTYPPLPDWVPPADAEGHPFVPGEVNWSWVWCNCSGRNGDGHHVLRCRVNGCRAPALWPPEHKR